MEEIKGNDMEYLVFEDKGIVVCKLWCCTYIAVNRIEKYATKLSAYEMDRYRINHTYVGVAKCDPEDKFDVEFGKRLALTKAKAKRGKAVNSAIRLFIRDQRRKLRTLEEYGMHYIPDVDDLLED